MSNSDALNSLLEDALSDLLEPKEQTDKEDKGKEVKTVETPKKPQSPSSAVDEEEMDRFFANMTEQLRADLPKFDPDEAQAKISESVPQIFDLMQNLLSKELLYPALNDLSPKFDKWLKKNSATLGDNDKKRYRKQRDLIKEIITTFDDDTIPAQAKFVKNLDLMEKMQSLGPPPDELTVSGGKGPNINEMMTNCPVM